jgi:hypothetical protein
LTAARAPLGLRVLLNDPQTGHRSPLRSDTQCERPARRPSRAWSGRPAAVRRDAIGALDNAASVEDQFSQPRPAGCPLERRPAHFDPSLESTRSRLARRYLFPPALLQLAPVGPDQLPAEPKGVAADEREVVVACSSRSGCPLRAGFETRSSMLASRPGRRECGRGRGSRVRRVCRPLDQPGLRLPAGGEQGELSVGRGIAARPPP